MPAPLGFKTHRIHILLQESDYKWLREKQQKDGDPNISATLRNLIRRLRGRSLEAPDQRVFDVIKGTKRGRTSP